MAQTKTRRGRPARRKALLASSDFISYLHEKAEQLAPADLQQVVADTDRVRERLETLAAERPRLRRQGELALRLIDDHAAGQCPQIPYYTVCLLAVAVLYFVDPLDVIPDWIPGVGTSDDALVFELAFTLGRAGIERYCTWKGIATDDVLTPAKPRVAARGPKRPAKRAGKR
jgi:uncharacterized membrane protein YkvA (DUF1232 family)